MANPEHLAILKQGVEAWNQWRVEHLKEVRGPNVLDQWVGRWEGVRPDLNGSDLNGADLCHVNLRQAKLVGTDLRRVNLGEADLVYADLRSAILVGADLHKANLAGADLSGAYLNGTNLCGANLMTSSLHGADLTEANLREAKLAQAKLRRTVLRGADLGGAEIQWIAFADMDLSEVNGLGDVKHFGPSTIGIDTIYRSHGKIPEPFLRGAGVPEPFIAYARSLVGKAIQFYSCFIGYSSQDQAIAERLHADLRAKGLRVWFAPEDLKIGDRFQERIEESIRFYDKVMIVLSEASIASPWVEREVNAAREREDREHRAVLFPIRIDDAVMDAKQPWAADLRRTRHIGDFTKWKDHDSYHKAFERLLRDLRADTSVR